MRLFQHLILESETKMWRLGRTMSVCMYASSSFISLAFYMRFILLRSSNQEIIRPDCTVIQTVMK